MSMKFGGCYTFGRCSASQSHVLSPAKAVQDQSISVQEETRLFCQQIDQQTVEGLHPACCLLTWYSHWTAPLDQQASIADVISITFYNTKI